MRNVKGQIIIVVLIICAVILTWLFILTSLILADQRFQTDISSSSSAYYAAESGVELAMINLTPRNSSCSTNCNLNGATYKYSIKVDPDNNSNLIIISSGTKNNITRTIQVVVPTSGPTKPYWPTIYQEIAPTATP